MGPWDYIKNGQTKENQLEEFALCHIASFPAGWEWLKSRGMDKQAKAATLALIGKLPPYNRSAMVRYPLLGEFGDIVMRPGVEGLRLRLFDDCFTGKDSLTQHEAATLLNAHLTKNYKEDILLQLTRFDGFVDIDSVRAFNGLLKRASQYGLGDFRYKRDVGDAYIRVSKALTGLGQFSEAAQAQQRAEYAYEEPSISERLILNDDVRLQFERDKPDDLVVSKINRAIDARLNEVESNGYMSSKIGNVCFDNKRDPISLEGFDRDLKKEGRGQEWCIVKRRGRLHDLILVEEMGKILSPHCPSELEGRHPISMRCLRRGDVIRGWAMLEALPLPEDSFAANEPTRETIVCLNTEILAKSDRLISPGGIKLKMGGTIFLDSGQCFISHINFISSNKEDKDSEPTEWCLLQRIQPKEEGIPEQGGMSEKWDLVTTSNVKTLVDRKMKHPTTNVTIDPSRHILRGEAALEYLKAEA